MSNDLDTWSSVEMLNICTSKHFLFNQSNEMFHLKRKTNRHNSKNFYSAKALCCFGHYNLNQFVVNTHIQMNNCYNDLELFRLRCKYCSGCKLSEINIIVVFDVCRWLGLNDLLKSSLTISFFRL